ncbi:MAG: caspase family protein [Bacteroidales bacterium]|nr:caspase family protein [Bacteroidales bacterium]
MKLLFKIIFFVLIFFAAFSMSAQELSIQTGHSATITDIKFTPDDKYLVSCGADNKIIIWDMTTFMQMKLLVGHTATVNSIAMKPDEKIFATASDDATVKIWNYPSGELMKTYKFSKPVKSIDYSPDGKTFACVSDSVFLIDYQTGKVTKLDLVARKFFTTVKFSENGAYLGIGGKQEPFVYVYGLIYNDFVSKHRSNANAVKFSDDGIFVYIAGDNGVLKRRQTTSGSEKKYSLWASNSWDSFFDVELTKEYFIGANRNKLIYVYEQSSGKRVAILNAHEKELRALAVTSDGKYLASAGKDRKIIIWNLERFSVTKVIEGGANSITSMAFSNDGNYMFLTYSDGSNRIWNLSNKGQILTNDPPKATFVQQYFMNEYSSNNSFFTINPDKLFVINTLDKVNSKTEQVDSKKQKLYIWDIKNYGNKHLVKNKKKDIYRQFFITDTINIVEVVYNATHLQEKSIIGGEKILDRQTVYSADVSIYSLNNKIKKRKISTKKLFLKDNFSIEGDVYFANISPDGEFFIDFKNSENGQICDLWDLKMTDKISTVLLDREYDFGGFSQSGTYFYMADNETSIVKIYKTSSQELLDSVVGIIPFVFSKIEEICAYTDNEKNLYLYNFKEHKPIFKVQTGHQTRISDIKFNSPYDFIATTAYDGLIKFWSEKTGEPLISLAAFDKSDFIYVSPENYYYSTKGAMKYISFLLNETLYTFDQFDIKYNRPDTVLSKLAYATPDEIEIYKKAYEKRVKKMGFSDFVFDETYHIPEISIVNIDEIPISTDNRTISVKIKAVDSIYNLDRINIWVNSVPIFGVKGVDIRELKTHNYSESFDVNLSSGKNKIDVTVINTRGSESLKKSFSIVCEQESKPELYIVAVGISNYADTSMNLDYAEKDANDVINLFSKKNKTFEKVNTLKLVNEQATRKNILALKETLKTTKEDDQVILFYAGHGLLDDNYNYFLTTHDFDVFDFFNSVVTYDEFVGLMDSIPARRKLVLIDACHSGEVDEEGDQTNEGAVNVNSEYESHGERSLWSQEFGDIPKFGSQNSFELMKMMFADLRRGSGTTIISSAGGQEYAYESKKIQNGVFTYVLITGLKSKKADINKDGKIMLSELQDYVMKTVSELTRGHQNPTNRRENLDYDFIIWE